MHDEGPNFGYTLVYRRQGHWNASTYFVHIFVSRIKSEQTFCRMHGCMFGAVHNLIHHSFLHEYVFRVTLLLSGLV